MGEINFNLPARRAAANLDWDLVFFPERARSQRWFYRNVQFLHANDGQLQAGGLEARDL